LILSSANFSLAGPLGSFRVPPGESRVGSDAACEVCIHGDGIMPVHAYLRADGDKILIRPANSDASGELSRAPIAVEGSLITGPATVLNGQSLAIGPVQLRLQRNAAPRVPLRARKWFRIAMYSALGLAIFAIGVSVYIRYVVLSEESFRRAIRESIADALGRDKSDVEVGEVDIHAYDNFALCKDIKVKERIDFQSPPNPNFILIPTLKVKLDIRKFLTSWGHSIQNLELTAYGDVGQTPPNPEIVIERSALDGSFNVEDIVEHLAKYQRRPRASNLTNLDFRIKIVNAHVTLNDPFTGIGQTSLEDLSLDLSMPRIGEPVTIDKCEMTVNASPAPPKKGTVSLTGRLNAVDENGQANAAKLNGKLFVELGSFDLARLFEHFGYAWEPQGTKSKIKVVLGKPINSKNIEVELKNPRDIVLKGDVTSESLISVKEEGQPPLGNFPMELKCRELHLVKRDEKGAAFVPEKMDVSLESWTDAARLEPPFLSFHALGQMNRDGSSSKYNVALGCGLEQLLNTDVGRRLHLDGTLGGMLSGSADLILESGDIVRISATVNGKDTFVMVPEPEDSPKRPGERAPVKQPLPLSFDFLGVAKRDAGGAFEYIDIKQFTLKASSFEAASKTSISLDFKSKDEQLSAQGQFDLTLHGREFCREFAPILALFGFKKPLEEDFALKVGVFGRQDIIAARAEGTASRKWSNDPAPVNLNFVMEYNRPQLLKPRGNMPYLSMSVTTKSSSEAPLNVNVEAHWTQRDGCDAIEFLNMKDGAPTGKPGIVIDADLAAFNNRFGPYVELLLQPRSKDVKTALLLALYRGSNFTGRIKQNAQVTIKHVENKTDHVWFDADTEVGFDAALTPEAMALLRAGTPGKESFKWSEKKLGLKLSGSYEQIVGGNLEEPDKLRLLNIDKLDVDGRLGKFSVGVRELDLLALASLRSAPNKTWSDAVAGMSINGTIAPDAAALLKSLRVLDPADPVSGTLMLEAAFDRKQDSVELKKFDFKQDGGFYVTHLDASGALAKVREISARLFPTRPEDSTLAERAAWWLDESGPSAVFQHLGKELTINSLELDAKPFRDWLMKSFKSNDGRRPPALFAGIFEQTWEPQGVWRARGVNLVRDPNYPDTWRLNGTFQSDLTASSSVTDKDTGTVPVITLAHPWKVILGLSVSKDNAAAMHGEILLDETELHATLPALKTELDKPAGEPLKVELEGCAALHNLLPTSIGRLHAAGKFGDFEMTDFTTPPDGAGIQFKIGKFSLKSTALTCSGSVAAFDQKGDKLEAHLEAPSMELRALPEAWMLAPRNSRGIERLKNASLNYKGGIGALLASARIPAHDPNNPGIQPASDALEIDGDLEGVGVDLSKNESFKIGGRLHFSSNELTVANFTGDLWRYEPSGTGGEVAKATLVQRYSAPLLRLKALEARQNLRQAMAARGLPLDISGDIACEKPLEARHILALRDAVKAMAPEAELGEAKDFLAASRLVINASIKAPAVAIAPFNAANFDLRNASLKDLKLSVPVLTVSYLSGRLKLEDAEYDFSRMAAKSGVLSDMKGLRHSQRVSFSDADLCLLLGATPDPVRYSICGKFGAQGNFSGVDFGALDRLSWNGVLQMEVVSFSVGSPLVVNSNPAPLPWMEHFKNHSVGRATLLSRASFQDTVSPLDLSLSGTPCSNAASVADGVLACAELYFAKVFGVERPHLEFEPIKPTVRFEKGLAVFEPIELKGKGASAGFNVQIKNLKISLADERFAEEALIFPTSLPQDAQDKLALGKWAPVLRQKFNAMMTDGLLPLRISGPVAAPTVKFPWLEVRAIARKALFDTVEAITDMDALTKSREHFFRVWGKDDAGVAAAAMLADRYSAGLPGTVSSRMTKDTILEGAQKLPPKIMEAIALTGEQQPKAPLLSPEESLKLVLFVEPEPPPPPVPPIPPDPTKATDPKQPAENPAAPNAPKTPPEKNAPTPAPEIPKDPNSNKEGKKP